MESPRSIYFPLSSSSSWNGQIKSGGVGDLPPPLFPPTPGGKDPPLVQCSFPIDYSWRMDGADWRGRKTRGGGKMFPIPRFQHGFLREIYAPPPPKQSFQWAALNWDGALSRMYRSLVGFLAAPSPSVTQIMRQQYLRKEFELKKIIAIRIVIDTFSHSHIYLPFAH